MTRTIGMAIAVAVLAAAPGAFAQQRGVTPTEVTFGMHTDLSGVAATYGVSSSNGVKMRFDEVNAAGGIAGRKLKVIVEDQGYQVPKAVQACNKLINRDKVFAFVAPLGTPMNNACFKDQFAAGVPNLFPLSAARSMYEPFERLKFYGAASYVDQIRAGIQYFVKNKGVKRVCVMYQDTDFASLCRAREVNDLIWSEIERVNANFARVETIKKFRLIEQQLTAEDDEVTPSM